MKAKNFYIKEVIIGNRSKDKKDIKLIETFIKSKVYK